MQFLFRDGWLQLSMAAVRRSRLYADARRDDCARWRPHIERCSNAKDACHRRRYGHDLVNANYFQKANFGMAKQKSLRSSWRPAMFSSWEAAA